MSEREKKQRKKTSRHENLAVPLDLFRHVFLTASLLLQTVPVVLESQRGRFATREEEEGLRRTVVKRGKGGGWREGYGPRAHALQDGEQMVLVRQSLCAKEESRTQSETGGEK